MIFKKINLKEHFPFLGMHNCNPTIDIYLPDNLTEMGRCNAKRPNIIICPGGGYKSCSQREAEPIAMQFLSENYNVFLLWYSVAPNRFPTQLREVAAVLELINKFSEEWGCDTEKNAIIGFSAGGHLAAHYSTSFDCDEIRDVFPESKPVQASVLAYPVISTNPTIAHLDSFYNLLGKDHLSQQDEEKFSCDLLVNKKTPPAFLWHTSNDPVVPMPNSLLYANALWEHGIPAELHIFPYGPHGLSTSDEYTNDSLPPLISRAKNWIPNAKEWLKIIFN